MSVIVLKPKHCEKAYGLAADAFAELYHKVTDKLIPISQTDDGVSDLVVIGSDAVNDFLMREVLELRLRSLGIRYGTDDYCIRSYNQNGRRVLILAGGRGRSTLYAVYDYFERFAGCHYFWDGDVLSHRETLPMEDICINESPRFEYRGLRYFAHRGLKRFQAEHWSFEDWKRELDWLVKKRLNFFMLRIGMDDVWQRAFPDDVPYPDGFNTITGTDAYGYDDRSDFWTLKYRGELRQRVLEYARALDLTYPVDCGTMTHWYSRTPESFLESKKPELLNQEIARYTASDTGAVFDYTKQKNMDYYMRLTETMVNEYDKSSELFHTIGLGERQIYKDKSKNFALKLIAYRRIAENLRRHYPNSKLMLASWDFAGWWSSQEVQALVKELDPERTLILDYTSEGNDPDCSFLSWGVLGKFPWIFGLFHAYESESELRGPYDRISERLEVAASDPMCKGMILWPELSHSDPLVLEYLADNAWAPLQNSVEQITERFCKNRYGEHAVLMNGCWQQLLPLIKLGDWGGFSVRDPKDEKYLDYLPSWYTHQDMWPKPLDVLKRSKDKRQNLVRYYRLRSAELKKTLPAAINALTSLSSEGEALKTPFILRDAIDLSRTVLGRMLNLIFANALDAFGDRDKLEKIREAYFEGLQIMQELLSTNSDFSMYHTLEGLREVADTNPDFEKTLKRNIGNYYCSQPAFEFVSFYLPKEATLAFDIIANEEKDADFDIDAKLSAVFEDFEKTPLASMQRTAAQTDKAILKTARFVEKYKGV